MLDEGFLKEVEKSMNILWKKFFVSTLGAIVVRINVYCSKDVQYLL